MAMFETLDLFGDEVAPEKQGSRLADTWDYPPFSVLNARDGWWQEHKRAWLALGIKGETGRSGLGDTCVTPMSYFGDGKTIAGDSGSVFDPVLCELAYRWFSPKGGVVLDPFAGGSVRGIVASHLGRKYVGVEIRREQVEANNNQGHVASTAAPPIWHCGDSINIGDICAGLRADMIFTCPPYADLEKYSDEPGDISAMDYPDFKAAYRQIIKESCALLRPDSFACVVVGEVRDKVGNYYNFVGDTVEAFTRAGLHYYNEAILVTPVGSLPVRTGRQFAAGRKLGKSHQNVLVFVKGDGKKAAKRCG